MIARSVRPCTDCCRFSLILLVLPTPAQSYSTEGCKGAETAMVETRANQSVTPAQVNSATTSFASTHDPQGIRLELKYTTGDNVGRPLYPANARC